MEVTSLSGPQDWTTLAPTQACSSGPHCSGLLQGSLWSLRCLEHKVTGRGAAECVSLRHPAAANSSRSLAMPQADPGASSKREGRKENTDLQAPPGGTLQQPCVTEGDVQALRGQESCPKVTEQVHWHWKPQQNPSLGRLCIRGAGPESWLL